MKMIVTDREPLPIPAPHPMPFSMTIVHPELMLWDSWCYAEGGDWHLYCLALSKMDGNGERIYPEDRNEHQFHVRHFESQDKGRSWIDRGVFQQPHITTNGYFDRNIWSGSVLPL